MIFRYAVQQRVVVVSPSREDPIPLTDFLEDRYEQALIAPGEMDRAFDFTRLECGLYPLLEGDEPLGGFDIVNNVIPHGAHSRGVRPIGSTASFHPTACRR